MITFINVANSLTEVHETSDMFLRLKASFSDNAQNSLCSDYITRKMKLSEVFKETSEGENG